MTLFPVGATPGVNISETLLDDVTGTCLLHGRRTTGADRLGSIRLWDVQNRVPVSLSYCNEYEAGL